MTSSVMVTYFREYVREHPELEYKVGSCASNQIVSHISRADIVLVSPHLGYMLRDLRKEYPGKQFFLIPAEAYAERNMELIISRLSTKDDSAEYIHNGLIVKLASFANTSKELSAISSAMSSLMIVLMTGSIFTLLLNFPWPAAANMIKGTMIEEVLLLGTDMTINLMSVYAVFLIGYYYAAYFDVSSPHAGINALICFLLIICSPGTELNRGLIDMTYLGAKGVFCAIFTAIISVRLYASTDHFGKEVCKSLRNIPEGIYQSFVSLIPTLISMVFFLIITTVFGYFLNASFPEWVYLELQNRIAAFAGDSIVLLLIMIFLTQLFWFFGIHGGSVVGTVINPILDSLSFENLTAFRAGSPLPHIINRQFRILTTFGGAGSTLPLCFLMAFMAKSQRMKRLGKAALPMGIFFINEPIIFGLPIIFNPLMMVPFILIPMISLCVTWVLMKMEILPYVIGINIPWTTPPLISGMIQGGWRLALWQLIVMIVQAFIWYPFFKVQDNKYLKEEKSDDLPDRTA
ncbi:MAG: PTS transporter subunit EIIC [Solobacterium sp.]|nr:PTS transporter subunit EIIC [Solobacterium sp.]